MGTAPQLPRELPGFYVCKHDATIWAGLFLMHSDPPWLAETTTGTTHELQGRTKTLKPHGFWKTASHAFGGKSRRSQRLLQLQPGSAAGPWQLHMMAVWIASKEQLDCVWFERALLRNSVGWTRAGLGSALFCKGRRCRLLAARCPLHATAFILESDSKLSNIEIG